MFDRVLSRALTWGLSAVCLAAFGIGAALYFALCSFTLGLIYARQLRPGYENRLRAQGLDAEACDAQLLPQDRAVAILRAVVALAVAWSFQRYA